MKKLLWIFSKAYRKFNTDRCPLLASALVHATTFSLFPLILVVLSISVFILGSSEGTIDRIMPILKQVFPIGIDEIIRNITAIKQTSITLAVIGFVGFLWASAAMFRAIESTMNVIWKVKKDRPFFRKSLITIGSAFLVFIGLFASIGVTFWGRAVDATGVGRFLPEISFVGSILLFGLIFKIFPNRRVRWREAYFGAVFTAVFWEIAKYLFSLYIVRVVDYSKIYGSLSAIIILFLWLYYTAYIFLFGAELSYVFARRKHIK
ncbi:MAG: YihY/virulence factor BrkB family protein [candidate division WOR-3 bacterium]|nr:MAG: YihY/virulence factor BrkB family protein [candidate division WOR-3 bacterium]